MATSAARSYLYLAGGNVASKLIIGAGQVMLGLFLTPAAFGTYALVIGVVMIANVLRDGGVTDHLIRLGPRVDIQVTDEALAGAIAGNVMGALMLAGVGQLVSARTGNGEVGPLLSFAALAMPIGSHFGVAAGVLQSRCQFSRTALLFLFQAAVQVICSLALASFLHSAYALILGLLASTAAGSILGIRLSGIRLIPHRNAWVNGVKMIKQSKWLMTGALGMAFMTNGDYIGLGINWPKALLGVYYFGYQIPAQLGGVASSVGQILLASLPRAGSAESRRLLLISGTSALGYVVTPLCFAIVLALPAAEKVIWGGRWDDAVLVGQILAALFPLRLLLSIVRSTLIASGEYARWTIQIGVAGLGMLATSVAVGSITDEPIVAALAIGGYLAAVVGVMTFFALRAQGITLAPAVKAVLVPYGTCASLSLPLLTAAFLASHEFGLRYGTVAFFTIPLYFIVTALAIRMMNPDVWRRIPAGLRHPFRQKKVMESGQKIDELQIR